MKEINIPEPEACAVCIFREYVEGAISCRFINQYLGLGIPVQYSSPKPDICRVKGITIKWETDQ
jgi:hypothetical protein